MLPRARKSEPNPVSDAVRKLRECLGQTQQAFAHSLGVAITTVARWETTRPPKGKTLSNLNKLASENNQWGLAGIFVNALWDELGLRVKLATRALLVTESSIYDDMLRHIESVAWEDPVKAEAELDYISEELNKFRKSKASWSRPPREPATTISESASDEQASPKERIDEK
jgi:transcriptional regulator with XRE-family HTH domain